MAVGAIVVLAAGVGYGVSAWRGDARIEELQAALTGADSDADAERESLTAELSEARQEQQQLEESSRAQIGVLEARRHLHLALDALDYRNFGTAAGLLESASELLSAHAGDNDALRTLSNDVGGARVVAAEDIYSQRERVRELTARLDHEIGGVELSPLPVDDKVEEQTESAYD